MKTLLPASILICLIFLSCNDGEQQARYSIVNNSQDERYSDALVKLQIAWDKGDSNMVRKWVHSLSDTGLGNMYFYNQARDLNEVIGVHYGDEDYSLDGFWSVPIKQRQIRRKNIYTIYRLYEQSCMFMKKIQVNDPFQFRDKYWRDSVELSAEDVRSIAATFESMCSD